jgi:hypothetical protein
VVLRKLLDVPQKIASIFRVEKQARQEVSIKEATRRINFQYSTWRYIPEDGLLHQTGSRYPGSDSNPEKGNGYNTIQTSAVFYNIRAERH